MNTTPHTRRFSLAVAVALGLGSSMMALTPSTLAQSSTTTPVRGTITVGSKLDSEARVLGQMIRLVLEANNFKVNDRTGFGTTDITRKALLAGEIDVYPEYTGTAISNFFKGEKIDAKISRDAARSYMTVKLLDKRLNNVEWLQRAPANNTFAIAIPKSLAEQEKLVSMADFANYIKRGGAVKLAGSQEFIERADALPSFEATYGFKLDRAKQTLVLAGATPDQTESAAASGKDGVNAAMAYGTDGALAALGLVVLLDPKGAQPVYQPVPIFRGEVVAKYPELRTMFEPLMKTLNEQVLQGLNQQIAVDGKNPADVARAYLQGLQQKLGAKVKLVK
jgi:osmoprotectant transport system substrate-binding protein